MKLRDQSMGAAHFQSLRSAVAQGLASGKARSAGQVLDRLEAKYAAQIEAEKAIGGTPVRNVSDPLHQKVI